MRLDKFLSNMGKASRTESGKLARAGKILVNGAAVKRADVHIDPEKDTVTLCGSPVIYKKFTYIMLNKPAGYVSATDDPREMTVLDLLPEEERRKNLFPCGRLDKDTLGLVILTNDGENAHRLLSPKHHADKAYVFKALKPLSLSQAQLLEGGVDIGGYLTKPCKITLDSDLMGGVIVLTEGKYHQIKRMLEAVDNKITYLERISFAGIKLDRSLERGMWRFLTKDEESLFTKGENKI
ncbi:MAG: rRNA pseudouridine synthase [Clostridia bacterium]|nr:rRNA pseudouridine synthase [Clostridia bacterium]